MPSCPRMLLQVATFSSSWLSSIPLCVCVCVCARVYVFWRRKWQCLPGESHGKRSLVSYSPWGCIELDTTAETCTCVCVHIHRMIFYSYAQSTSHNSISVTTEYLLHTIFCETSVTLYFLGYGRNLIKHTYNSAVKH